MAVAIAVTPPLLAILALRHSAPPSRPYLIAMALLWILGVVLYRALSHAYGQYRRKVLRQEVANVRQARLEAAAAFQDQLLAQEALLDRIVDISQRLLDDGIIDPHLALRNVGLILSHARDAQIGIDDAIIETQVGIGAERALIAAVNVRDQIEEVASPFGRRGISIVTAGPTLYATTDAAMLRLIIRSLINGAVAREADQIDVTIASDVDHVVCTVSDDGADTSKQGMKAVSALALSLAATIAATLDCSHVLGRNRYSVSVPLAETPSAARTRLDPVDVLGAKPIQPGPHDEADTADQSKDASDLVLFPAGVETGRSDSVAARRKRQLAPR